MKRANIVLGLGFGDEGKGLMVSSLISKAFKVHSFMGPGRKDTIVVRFSGGQQCGHTVIYDGVKHTHASYGSGTLQGVPTYISEHCTVDPVAMVNEAKVLKDKGIKVPTIYIHPLAKVTTSYDIEANIEDGKYIDDGTTGMGVGKTIERHNAGLPVFAIDFTNLPLLKEKLKSVARYYEESLYEGPFMTMAHSLEELDFRIAFYDMLHSYEYVIFEGSQGIMLDMDHGTIPNVTYSNTTCKNAIQILKDVNFDFYEKNLRVYYVTRSYLTRHGNGWMDNERYVLLKNNEEETNVFDSYQGKFRTGKLNIDQLEYALKVDAIYCPHEAIKDLMVTCMDQHKIKIPAELTSMVDMVHFSYSADGTNIRIK